MSALLELNDVEARYGPVLALRGISLAVPEGAVVAVLGANGAGKTTTLRSVSGTVKRSGEILLDGKPLRGGPEASAKAGIAHVPEGRGTFTELSVVENLRLGAYTRRTRSLKADIDRMATYFPWISERGEQRAGTLSGGEQQMLALARALMGRPRLLMLDEPSLGLAPLIVKEIFRIVRELNEKEGLTVLVVEQDARIALNAASTAYVLEVGKVAVSGSSRGAARRRSSSAELSRVLMAQFFQQVVSGLASGGIYGLLALALVLIHRATGVVNFAQGEMAMFSTYIAWTLTTNHGVSYWPAFAITLLASFAGGFGIHQAVIRPVERGSQIRVVIVTIGLLLVLNGLATWIWTGEVRAVRSPFPGGTFEIGDVAIAYADVGTIAVCFAAVARDVGVLPVHEGRARAARRSGQPQRGAPGRRPRPADARPRLGPRCRARSDRGNADGAERLPRPEHDAVGADLRLCGGRARRDRLADRGSGRRPDPRRRPQPASAPTSTSSAPTSACLRRCS